MKKKYRVTLKSAMIIVVATLMVCAFGCSKKSDATTPMEKMNHSATKAGDSLNKTVKETADKANEVDAVAVFTCSMHPQIKLAKPGKCPICAMDLIPVTGNK